MGPIANPLSSQPSPRLLVSVRSATEARAALAGGVHLIDIKDPTRGSLGRAADAVLATVLTIVAGRRPVSAALGELLESPELPPYLGELAFIKWGLAGCVDRLSETLNRAYALRQEVHRVAPHCQVVFAAYADAARARSPAVSVVCALACQQPGGVFLIDTFDKLPTASGQRLTLLDWLTLEEIAELRAQTRAARVQLALAGSLGVAEIARVLPLQPDWIAVRGAACERGRESTVSVERVRALAALLGGEV